MNKLSLHQSQIQKNDNGYKIEVTSPIQKWSEIITPSILIATTVILFISTMLSEILAQLLFLILLIEIFLYFFKYIFVADITIENSKIQQGNKIILLRNIPYLDFHVKMLSNGVRVRVKNIEFKLNDVADIPVLTDILEQTANVDFYENYQLSDDSEVLTFKAKHLTIPRFTSFLTIQDTANLIRFYDMTNQFCWFEIRKNNATLIHYSKPKGDEYITERIRLSNLKKLQVIIDNRAGVTKQFRQLSLLAIEKTTFQNKIVKTYNTYFTPTNYTYIFHSKLRNAKAELTNMRDGEKMYELLKNLTSLANIKIEKVIINS